MENLFIVFCGLVWVLFLVLTLFPIQYGWELALFSQPDNTAVCSHMAFLSPLSVSSSPSCHELSHCVLSLLNSSTFKSKCIHAPKDLRNQREIYLKVLDEHLPPDWSLQFQTSTLLALWLHTEEVLKKSRKWRLFCFRLTVPVSNQP